MRAVAGQPATIRLQVATDGGSPQSPDATPTITVVAGDGQTVLYAAQAGVEDDATGVGAYKWQLPGQARLDTLTATWSYTVGGVATTTAVPVKIVARRLADPYLCRQDPTIAGLGLTDAQLLELIDSVEDKIEEFIGYPPVLSGARAEWDTLRGALTDALYIAGTLNGLPFGAGAGRMRIPGVVLPVAGQYSDGTAVLHTAITPGTVTTVVLAGQWTGVIGSGFTLELVPGLTSGEGVGGTPAVTAVTTSAGSYDGTSTTYTVSPVAVTTTITAGQGIAYAGPAGGPGLIYGGSINGVPLDPISDIPHLVIINGMLGWTDYRPWISGRYTLWLTHGEVVPRGDLCKAARRLVRYYAQGDTSLYPDRASQVITDKATIVMNFADRDHPTGIPDVDAVLVDTRLESVI